MGNEEELIQQKFYTTHSAWLSEWRTHAHVRRDGGVCVGARGCCKSSGSVCEPLCEMSRWLDARWSIRSARTHPS